MAERHHLWPLGALILTGGLLLGACGGGPSGTNTAVADTTSTAAPTTTAAGPAIPIGDCSTIDSGAFAATAGHPLELVLGNTDSGPLVCLWTFTDTGDPTGNSGGLEIYWSPAGRGVVATMRSQIGADSPRPGTVDTVLDPLGVGDDSIGRLRPAIDGGVEAVAAVSTKDGDITVTAKFSAGDTVSTGSTQTGQAALSGLAETATRWTYSSGSTTSPPRQGT
jgi:hypothetical protein